MITPKRGLAAWLIALLAITGCGDEAPAVEVEGDWQIQSIDNELVAVGVNTIEIPRIQLASGTIQGHDGCNGFGADYEVRGSKLFVSMGDSTTIGCSIPDGSDQPILTEQVLDRLFELPDGIEVDRTGDTIVWSGGGHRVLLVLSA